MVTWLESVHGSTSAVSSVTEIPCLAVGDCSSLLFQYFGQIFPPASFKRRFESAFLRRVVLTIAFWSFQPTRLHLPSFLLLVSKLLKSTRATFQDDTFWG